MAWLYLPESVVSNLESDSHSEPNVTALSVMLNGKVTPRPLSWRGWQRRKWTMRLCGTTLKHSTAERGAALWIASLRATRANHSVTPDSDAAQTTQDTFSPTSPASSGSANQYSVSLKTWERTFGLDSEKSSPSWRTYITALRRDYSARSKWALRMNANGSLSWRSPNAKEPGLSAERLDGTLGHRMYDKQTGRLAQVGLIQQAKLWATPNTAMTVGETNPNLERRGKKFYNKVTGREVQTALSTEVRHWKSPSASDGEGGIMEIRAGANAHLKLRDTAANWMSPNVGDSKGREYQRDNGKKGKERLTLVGESKNWNTPRSHKVQSMTLLEKAKTKSRLENQVLIFQSTPQDPTPTTNGETSYFDFLSLLPPSKKRLNPTFTEWLMGLPLGWTNPDTKSNYRVWETQFRQLLQDLLSAYWQSDLK